MDNQLSPEIVKLLKDPNALIPVITQEVGSGEVLMFAYMNTQALNLSIQTGKATYWSRSRNELWEKGATSGNTQLIHSITLDCDGDAILLKVEQKGVACHTGDKSCFHQKIK
jgi:phosphoribosyl-AMP cyclohydrolase